MSETESDVSVYVNRCLTQVRCINAFRDSLYGDFHIRRPLPLLRLNKFTTLSVATVQDVSERALQL
jgi:hypothetical protein